VHKIPTLITRHMSISITSHFMANPYIYINNNHHKLIMVGVFVDDGLGHCAYTSSNDPHLEQNV